MGIKIYDHYFVIKSFVIYLILINRALNKLFTKFLKVLKVWVSVGANLKYSNKKNMAIINGFNHFNCVLITYQCIFKGMCMQQ